MSLKLSIRNHYSFNTMAINLFGRVVISSVVCVVIIFCLHADISLKPANFTVYLNCSCSGKVVCSFMSSKVGLLSFAEYKVHSYNRNGLCSLGFMDDHYPVRSAFSLLNQVKRLFFVACCINNLWT